MPKDTESKTINQTIKFGVFEHTHATARAPGKYFSQGPDGHAGEVVGRWGHSQRAAMPR